MRTAAAVLTVIMTAFASAAAAIGSRLQANLDGHGPRMTWIMARNPEAGSRRLSVLVVGAVVFVLAAASMAVASPTTGPAPEPACVEPHPCEYVWEGAGLGPFELGHIGEVWADSEDDDGTMLHG